MINLLVDEAYAFDFLSIFYIKRNNSDLTLKVWNECKNYIKDQIPNKFDKIIKSKEYKDLLKANQKTFKAVDEAKVDKVKASYVDSCNYQRYLAKKALQTKFFSTSLKETKIGYK
jgi:Fe-S oxidoreductase